MESEDQRVKNLKGLKVDNLNWTAEPMENGPNHRYKEITGFPSPFEEKILTEERRKAQIVSTIKEEKIDKKENIGLFLIVGVVILVIGYKLSH